MLHNFPQYSPMLIGEMDSSGSLNAHSLLHLSEKIRTKAVFQVRVSQNLSVDVSVRLHACVLSSVCQNAVYYKNHYCIQCIQGSYGYNTV